MSDTTVKNTVTYLEDDYVVWENPLRHHVLGLTYTATGYGAKLPTRYMLTLNGGCLRRIYATCFSNVASYWVLIDGHKFFLRDSDFGAKAAASQIK